MDSGNCIKGNECFMMSWETGKYEYENSAWWEEKEYTPLPRPDTKVCPHCGLTKTLDSFYINKSGVKKGKLFSRCKVCECSRYKHNPAKRHAYYLSHKKDFKRRARAWLDKNKIKWRMYMRGWRLRRKEERGILY